MRQEVKDAALRQLAAGGPQALSVNAIAKELGVSGPALYRYFAGRDALLTELILDAYADLTRALAGAPAPGEAAPEKSRLPALADAYRAWAVAQPHRYRLLFSAPLPGYDAPDDRLVAAAQKAMGLILAALDTPGRTGDATLDAQLGVWWPGVEPARALAGITGWSRLHGIVSLEIEGNFASMGVDADRLFEREVASVLSSAP
jgi:AcrR family transcriptional regulator